jgi:hypothetical protein
MLFEPFFAAMQISLTIPKRTQRTSRQMACPMGKLEPHIWSSAQVTMDLTHVWA